MKIFQGAEGSILFKNIIYVCANSGALREYLYRYPILKKILFFTVSHIFPNSFSAFEYTTSCTLPQSYTTDFKEAKQGGVSIVHKETSFISARNANHACADARQPYFTIKNAPRVPYAYNCTHY